jgi:hypothetical protein
MSIIHSLEDLEIPAEQRNQAVSNMFLIRTAQVLETMSKVYDSEAQPLNDEFV